MSAGLVSHELSTLINWLLEKDSSKRPTIKDILNESFVRAKLEENQLDELRFNKASSKFELPVNLRGCTLTNHLSPPHQHREYKSEEEEYKSSLSSSSSSQYNEEKYTEQSNHVNNTPPSVIPSTSNNIWRDHPPVLPRPMNGVIRKTTRGTGVEKEKSAGAGSREVAVSHTTHFASSPLVRPAKQPANYAVSSSGGLPLDQVRGDR
jgi:serine/threonine protein kinase